MRCLLDIIQAGAGGVEVGFKTSARLEVLLPLSPAQDMPIPSAPSNSLHSTRVFQAL